MGAWHFVEPLLADLIRERWPFYYLGRPASSSPAEGWSAWHVVNQKLLVEQAWSQEKTATEVLIIWKES
jgi:2-oxoglutarate dehydrogenase E1 component